MHTHKHSVLNLRKDTYLKLALVFLLALLLSSCVSKKKILYFQDTKGLNLNDSITNYEPKIQFGDILNINVSSPEPDAAIPYNIFETQNNGVARPLPYIVTAKGYINFPSIGQFQVAGLTIEEVTEQLKNKLLPFLNEPIINVRLQNFKISVLGEVRLPGSYPVTNERITIMEAIALAGDLTIYGNREAVTLIREQDGKRTIAEIDLTDRALFNSPYYYLTQNDIVYVEPNKTRVNSSSVGPNSYILVSIVSVLISVAAIIIR